ncbi:hypothetical protein HUK80_17715 [Flavobacterium sp. MAH-1]|uniref:Uncharacterized protein n=2 Tax=Flavobacterium agri TaxID=2743471 RepID=A0A7Y9C8U4_9FLAO|nr:hypothetical protein [Flavobacterium agri]NYA72768.1 hypothetical protein [Flavobacterium agri]
MERKTVLRIIYYNLVLVVLVGLDLALPGNIKKTGQLESIYSVQRKYGSGRRPSYVKRDLVSFTDGEIFLLGKFPKIDLERKAYISVVQSPIFSNTQEIVILENKQNVYVGFFSNMPVASVFLVSTLLTLINCFNDKKIFQIGLVFSTMAISIISIIYIFYF